MAVNPSDRQRAYSVMTAMGEFDIPKVENMKVLGTELPSDGGSWQAFEARVAAADRAFYSKKNLLQNRSAPMKKRLEAFYKFVGSVFLYGCEGW
eukprot:6006536-Lingulodinium_polyedra.AAC.1